MAENDFNLGQAMGDYEKANADREFYLSMIQQGQTNRGAFMASPIAAYLAGVAGVKMASMKQQAVEAQQAITDEKQKKEDAQRAAEKALERRDNLYNNLYNIAQKARKGELAPSTAGAMGGYIVREMGGKPISFDVDNGLFDFELNGEEYQLDLNEKPSTAQRGKELQNAIREQNLEAGRVRAEQAKKKGELDIALKQKRLADTGSKKDTDAWTTYSTQYKDALEDMDLFSDNALVSMLGAEGIAGMIQDAEALPKSRQEALGRKLNRLKDIAKRYNIELTKATEKETKSTGSYSF